MQQRTFLTGLAVLILAAQACGSEDGKKKVNSVDAGAGGEGGVTEPAAGGSSAGEAASGMAGEPPIVGAGGMGGAGEAGGAAGTAGTAGAGEGGSAGEPPVVVPPDLELLFSVKPGAQGLSGTAVLAAQNPENEIFSSKTAKQTATAGTNTTKIKGELLGLDPTDELKAFALPQTEPAAPLYLFSLADGSEGANHTRAWFARQQNTVAGSVFYSDGVQSLLDPVEGGTDSGYNALLASERSIGLALTETDNDLTGLAIHDANVAITEVYFVVPSNATGAAGTAVASTPYLARGCTVFKSSLDGKNSVAFTCAQLGLFVPIDNIEASGDQIDALAIYGDPQPSKVVFSVTAGSSGADGTAVATAVTSLDYQIGAALFTSAGDGKNALLKAPNDLGLGYAIRDELDALAVIDSTAGAADKAGSCNLTFDPRDATAGGGLSAISGVTHVGNALVIVGLTATQTVRWLAYDPKTCAFLQQVDLPAGFDATPMIATVPLSGWAADKPLDKVEFLRLTSDATSLVVNRHDGTGAFVQTFPIANTYYYSTPRGLVYDAPRDRLYVLTKSDSAYAEEMRVVPRPDASVQQISVTPTGRTMPCTYSAELSGVDADGNLVLAMYQRVATKMRVCRVAPEGELLLAPYWWTVDTNSRLDGFFAADGSHYLAHTDATPITIERGLYHYP